MFRVNLAREADIGPKRHELACAVRARDVGRLLGRKTLRLPDCNNRNAQRADSSPCHKMTSPTMIGLTDRTCTANARGGWSSFNTGGHLSVSINKHIVGTVAGAIQYASAKRMSEIIRNGFLSQPLNIPLVRRGNAFRRFQQTEPERQE